MTATITRLEGGVHSDYAVRGGTMTVSLIYVPARERGKGAGTRELQRLTDIADAHGWAIRLVADAVFGVPVAKLVAWYQRHGLRIESPLTAGRMMMVRDATQRPQKGNAA